MRDVYIIGTGISPWLGYTETNFSDFGAVAVENALKDADLEWQKIQAIMAGIFIWGGNAGHLAGQYLESIFGETGVPVVNVYNACATGTASLRMAYNSVAAGETDTALAYGADVSPKGFFGAKTDDAVQDRDVIRWKMTGMPNPVYWALEARKRMEKFGTTEEDLSKEPILNHYSGNIKTEPLWTRFFYFYQQSQFQNAPFRPISALGGNFNPRDTLSIPVVEISAPP